MKSKILSCRIFKLVSTFEAFGQYKHLGGKLLKTKKSQFFSAWYARSFGPFSNFICSYLGRQFSSHPQKQKQILLPLSKISDLSTLKVSMPIWEMFCRHMQNIFFSIPSLLWTLKGTTFYRRNLCCQRKVLGSGLDLDSSFSKYKKILQVELHFCYEER